ncbi:hypothetical protein ACTFIY_009750 [Dictyostelium cf. discoideum]
MSDKYIFCTQLKNYFEYLCGSGITLQDLLFKENFDFRSITINDIGKCFILILYLALLNIFSYLIFSIFYILVHTSVFVTLKNKNSLHAQKHKSDISKNGIFNFSFLGDGSYEAEFFIENGDKFTPDFIDLSTSLVDISFRAFDKPVSNSNVKGTIEMQNNGSKVSFTSKTDENGTCSTFLPECKFSIYVDGTVDGKPVKMNEVIDIRKPKVINNLEELKHINQNHLKNPNNVKIII